MKLNSKLVIVIALFQIVHAREIIVISYKTKTANVDYLLKNIQEEVTPKLVSSFIKDNPCVDTYKDVVLHLCVDENDEVKIVRQNVEVLKRSISKL